MNEGSNNIALFEIIASNDQLLKVNATSNGRSSTFTFGDELIPTKFYINEDGEVETQGARVQLKQQLGIGIIYAF